MKKWIAIFSLSLVLLACGHQNCENIKIDKEALSKELSAKMLAWHKGAATANGDAHFGAIAGDGIYIGTDDHERWTKQEFMDFAKPHFAQGNGWEFKTIERNWHYSKQGNVAWFDELLDTWMGVCRGSGVWELEKEEWKLKHYHLAITVPNEIVKDYLEVLKKFQETEKQ